MALFMVRLIERVSGGFGVLGAIVIAPLVIATTYEVLARYLFNAPTIWAYELAYMAMGTNFLLGAAFTLRERGHIRIDVAYSNFPPRVQALIDVIGYLFLFLPVAWWLTWGLWKYAYYALLSGETSGESAWNPVIWPFRMIFFAGILLLSLQGVAELIKSVYTLLGRDFESTTGGRLPGAPET